MSKYLITANMRKNRIYFIPSDLFVNQVKISNEPGSNNESSFKKLISLQNLVKRTPNSKKKKIL